MSRPRTSPRLALLAVAIMLATTAAIGCGPQVDAPPAAAPVATPPELAQDLLEVGIHLVGGGAMLRGLDRLIARETGVPVRPVEMPLETVVLGAGRCLESFDRLRDMFMDRTSR